ncbi:metal-dependent hydrolase [Candidatus Pacearchaeota archaeon]|nr:metal-dependent hydrolase [Candidatus Pacearchaeota archaeon]
MENKVIFVIVALIATFIPDIDTKFSKLGKKKVFRPLQFFVSHRGFFHSFIFLGLIILLFLLFLPIIIFPFALGYSSHLLADAFTIQGIRPFYPFKTRIKGKIKTGGRLEIIVFVCFLITDLLLLSSMMLNISLI